MKYTVLIMTLFIMQSCGDTDYKSETYGIPGPAGIAGEAENCSVADFGSYVEISCPGSPVVTISDGSNGADGQDGSNGENGQGCSVTPVIAGIEALNGGALIVCSVGSVLILNGEPGSVGADGEVGEPGPVSALAIAEIIDPCGNAAGLFDEVLLKLGSGQLIASLSNNGNALTTRLALIEAGNYMTTDGSSCNFSVDNAGNVSW